MTALVTPTAVLLAPPGIEEEEWTRLRAGGFGGSDIAALLGLDRYRSPMHVWQAKMGNPDRGDSEAAKWGRRLEGVIAEAFAEESGLTVLPEIGTLAHVDEPRMRANIDRLVIGRTTGRGPALVPDDEVAPLECKNRSERRASEWRDDVPDQPALQAHWYLAVTGYTHAWVAALLGGNRLRYYRLERDQELIDHLVGYCMRWWDEHVATGIAPRPDGSKATTELLAHLWEAKPEAEIEVNASRTVELIAKRTALRERIGRLQTDLNAVENEMRLQLGENEVAKVRGRTAYTCVANGTFRAKQFRAEQPELAAKYVKYLPAVDTAALAEDEPDVYRRYRSRVLRVPDHGVI